MKEGNKTSVEVDGKSSGTKKDIKEGKLFKENKNVD